MPTYSFEGIAPTIHPSAFIADTATVIGDVTIEEGASVWYGAVLRGDYAPITVRAGANIQDNSILHTPPGMPCEIGAGATIAHNCVVHGATIGAEALIANGTIVLDGAVVGARSLVAAGALVRAGQSIGEGMLAVGTPAVEKGALEGTPNNFWVEVNQQAYRELAVRHREGIVRLD